MIIDPLGVFEFEPDTSTGLADTHFAVETFNGF